MLTRTIHRIEESFLCFLLVSMTLLVFFEVVLRFGFNTGISWVQEMTLHTSAWFVLFGCSYGIRVGAHIGVDAVVRLLSPSGKRFCGLLAVSLSLIYCLLLLLGGWVYISKMYTLGLGMEDSKIPMAIAHLLNEDFAWNVLRLDVEDPAIPLWVAHGPIFLGIIFLAIRLAVVGWKILTGQIEGMDLADEAKDALKELAPDALAKGEAK